MDMPGDMASSPGDAAVCCTLRISRSSALASWEGDKGTRTKQTNVRFEHSACWAVWGTAHNSSGVVDCASLRVIRERAEAAPSSQLPPEAGRAWARSGRKALAHVAREADGGPAGQGGAQRTANRY